MSFTNFPEHLMDSVKLCSHGHATLHSTPEQARNAKCPICSRLRKANASGKAEPTPRSLDPEPWATGYGEQRARESRRRGIEKSREVRRSA